MKNLVFSFVAAFLIGTFVHAEEGTGVIFPDDPAEFAGAFQAEFGKVDFHLIITPNPQRSAFKILLIETSGYVSVFIGEAISSRTIGITLLYPEQRNFSRLTKWRRPEAVLQIQVNEDREVERVSIRPQEGSLVFTQSVDFNETSKDFRSTENYGIAGDFKNDDDFVQMYWETDTRQILNVRSQVLQMDSEYSRADFISGLGALRAFSLDGNLQRHESPKIGGIVLPIIYKNKPAIILGNFEQGSPRAKSLVLKKD